MGTLDSVIAEAVGNRKPDPASTTDLTAAKAAARALVEDIERQEHAARAARQAEIDKGWAEVARAANGGRKAVC